MALSVSTRSVLNRWFPVLIVALLVVAGVALFVAYDAHTGEPEETTREQVTDEWSVDAEFTHATTVVGESSVFDEGERLEGRSVYFTQVMPELAGTHTLQYDTTGGTDASATVDISLQIQSVDTVDGQDVVYWEDRMTLVEAESLTIAGGAEESTEVTVDIPDVQSRVDDIEAELGGSPGEVELSVVAETSVSAELDGEDRTEQRTDELVLTLDNAFYRVTENIGGTTSAEQTEQTTVTEEPSALSLYGFPAIAVVSIGVAVGLVVARRRGSFAVSDEERRRYECETARKDFDDWISRGNVPELTGRTVITVDSLESLVDTAIDSNRRVLEATDTDRYVVILDDIVYEFFAPESDVDADAEVDNEPTDTDPAETEQSLKNTTDKR